MDFPDFDYGKAYPEDGSVKNDKQVLWDDNYVITTELHENGRIERIINLGTFNFKDNTLSQDGSTWDYRAEFTYRPKVSFLKWGTPPYIDNGDGLESNYESVTEEVESGLIYKYRKDTAYPQWDPENNRETQISYSSSCNYDASNNRIDCQSYKNQSDVTTTSSRKQTEKILGKYLERNWWEQPWSLRTMLNPNQDESEERSTVMLSKPSKFKKNFVDKITNFNPSTDTLDIDTDSFGIDSSATFASGKNKKVVKKKLAKQDFDFLYDEKKGGLYFNENGADKGFGDGGIIVILKGAPDLTSTNLEFI